MKPIATFLILFLFLNNIQAQSPYKLSKNTEWIIAGTTATMLVGDYFANQSITLLSDQDINDLDASKINSFDRQAASLYSDAANFRSHILFCSAVGIDMIGSAWIGLKNKENEGNTDPLLTIFILGLETNVFTETGTDLLKSSIKRTRPYAYNPDFPSDEKYKKNARKSFISGHASLTAANTFFFAKVFSDYYPNSKWKPLVWTIAATVPAWTGVERVLAGKHFPTDVISGYIFGAACGYFIPQMHKIGNAEQAMNLQAMPFTNSFGSGVSMVMNF